MQKSEEREEFLEVVFRALWGMPLNVVFNL
jgi:hypothetical protein